MSQWLTKPSFNLTLEPGERPPYEEAKSVTAKGKQRLTKNATAGKRGPKREVPPVGSLAALDFPDVTHASLSNGVELQYAQRAAVPVTQLALSFDAGDRRRRAQCARPSVDGHVDARRGHDEAQFAADCRGQGTARRRASRPAARSTVRR